ncbi:MAG: DUF6328 family protein [Blastococcus sp.]
MARRGSSFDVGARRSARSRGETLDQVLDRNLHELLQELRVAITGVQILFAFLLGMAFTQRFTSLSRFDVTVYTITLLTTALTTLVLIAPVAFHRLVFRRRKKATLIMVADRLLLLGLGLLVLAISCAVALILDVVLGRAQGLAGGLLVAVAGVLIWFGLPAVARRADARTAPDEEDGEPAPEG